MKRNELIKFRFYFVSILLSLLMYGCSQLFHEKSLDVFHHPPTRKARLLCTDCHEGESVTFGKTFEHFDHTPRFIDQHRIYASQDPDFCNVCHKEDFCTDCHSTKNITKPQYKKNDRPDKIFPHRGDYLIKHRHEGKNFPDKCFKCHGRKNNKKCKYCHK